MHAVPMLIPLTFLFLNIDVQYYIVAEFVCKTYAATTDGPRSCFHVLRRFGPFLNELYIHLRGF